MWPCERLIIFRPTTTFPETKCLRSITIITLFHKKCQVGLHSLVPPVQAFTANIRHAMYTEFNHSLRIPCKNLDRNATESQECAPPGATILNFSSLEPKVIFPTYSQILCISFPLLAIHTPSFSNLLPEVALGPCNECSTITCGTIIFSSTLSNYIILSSN